MVAAKAIDTQGSMDRKRAIAHEIRMLRRLNHGNVIGLRGYEEVGTTCYIFMELASKGDLFEVVLARGALTECEASSLRPRRQSRQRAFSELSRNLPRRPSRSSRRRWPRVEPAGEAAIIALNNSAKIYCCTVKKII